jgi:hypothetical protein
LTLAATDLLEIMDEGANAEAPTVSVAIMAVFIITIYCL